MAALTANRALSRYTDQQYGEYPVLGATIIYRDAFVGLHPVLGYLKPYEGGDIFVGIADGYVDNSTGSNGSKYCKVLIFGDVEISVTNADFDDVGRDVYATNSGDAALRGHRDGFIGFAVQRGNAVGKLRVRLCGVAKPSGVMRGSVELRLDGATAFTATGATAGTNPIGGSGFFGASALGLGITQSGESLLGTFDAVAEVASATLYAPSSWTVSNGGMVFWARLQLTDIADAAAMDFDFGIGSVLTANSIANIDHADMVHLAAFHLDGATATILGQSDDNVTDVSSVTTGVSNVATANGHRDYHVVIRPTGLAELYIDWTRVLSGTTLAVGAAGVLAPFVNMEKTSDDTTAVFNLTGMRFTAAKAA